MFEIIEYLFSNNHVFVVSDINVDNVFKKIIIHDDDEFRNFSKLKYLYHISLCDD